MEALLLELSVRVYGELGNAWFAVREELVNRSTCKSPVHFSNRDGSAGFFQRENISLGNISEKGIPFVFNPRK